MGRHATPRGHRARADRRRPRRRRGLRVLGWTTAFLVLLGGTGTALVVHRLSGNVKSVDIDATLGGNRPQTSGTGAMNILLLGSDSRSNAGESAKGGDPGRSDTTMVLHVYQDHRRAALVSIPRDTMVTRPACTTPSGGKDPGGPREMFNASFTVGGPACTVSTVERMSGLRMDHYLELDFNGFKKVVDALGGVDITLTRPLKDRASGIDLKAGRHHVDGERSLALVRTRSAVGDGGDLGRIQLQQAFLKALLAQVGSAGTLGNPARLLAVADTATKAMTTDSKLAGATALVRLASDLKGLDSSKLQALTLPVRPYPQDVNRVQPMEAESRRLWDALRADQPVPESVKERSMGDKGSAGGVIAP
ncbi:LCP family protein [Streptomyces sp. NPDC001594]|uniref:LCP family protein n=1 Tax=Streptomyces sp. NPDC001594 TaxID=3364590 RepID=UPI0036746AB2